MVKHRMAMTRNQKRFTADKQNAIENYVDTCYYGYYGKCSGTGSRVKKDIVKALITKLALLT
jgi:hypothetical protein